MLVANQKLQENIAEYLLYMWQIEDMIRAVGGSPNQIEEHILPRYSTQSASERLAILEWYTTLAEELRAEGKEQSGHLERNKKVLKELEGLHRYLLEGDRDYIYTSLHYQVLPAIIELRNKGADKSASDLETCFSAIYGYLTLTLKGAEISEATRKSMQQITTLLAMLAHRYNDRKGISPDEIR